MGSGCELWFPLFESLNIWGDCNSIFQIFMNNSGDQNNVFIQHNGWDPWEIDRSLRNELTTANKLEYKHKHPKYLECKVFSVHASNGRAPVIMCCWNEGEGCSGMKQYHICSAAAILSGGGEMGRIGYQDSAISPPSWSSPNGIHSQHVTFKRIKTHH